MSNQLGPSQLNRQQEKANLEEEKLWYIQAELYKALLPLLVKFTWLLNSWLFSNSI